MRARPTGRAATRRGTTPDEAGGPDPADPGGRDRDTPQAPPAGHPAGHAPRRVLLVDDDGEFGLCYASLLRARGYEAWYATDAIEAIELARRFRPDFVVADIGLPEISGIELVARLRREGGEPRAIYLALTGHDDEEFRLAAGDAGFDAYMTKPVRFSDVLRFIDHPDVAAPPGGSHGGIGQGCGRESTAGSAGGLPVGTFRTPQRRKEP